MAGDQGLDGPELLPPLPSHRNLLEVRAVIVREVGHVVGLDRVPDPAQILLGDNLGQTTRGAGDRTGLALLGAGPCVPGL